MHGAIVLNAVGRVSRATPVLGVVLAIRPLGRVLTIKGEARLSLVVSKLYGELATGGESNGVAILWRVVETAQRLSPLLR